MKNYSLFFLCFFFRFLAAAWLLTPSNCSLTGLKCGKKPKLLIPANEACETPHLWVHINQEQGNGKISFDYKRPMTSSLFWGGLGMVRL